MTQRSTAHYITTIVINVLKVLIHSHCITVESTLNRRSSLFSLVRSFSSKAMGSDVVDVLVISFPSLRAQNITWLIFLIRSKDQPKTRQYLFMAIVFQLAAKEYTDESPDTQSVQKKIFFQVFFTSVVSPDKFNHITRLKSRADKHQHPIGSS